MLNDLDCIDECFVSDDEDFFDEVVLCRLVIEIDVGYVPDLELARCIAGDKGIVVFSYRDCSKLFIFWMFAVELELWLAICNELVETPKSKPLICGQ